MRNTAEWVLVLVLLFVIVPGSASVNISSQGLIVSKAVSAGGSITIIELLHNTGDEGSEPVTIRYYLTNSSIGSSEPVPIGSADLDPMVSGGDYTSVNTFLLPMNLADGAYKFVRQVMGKGESSPRQDRWIADYPITVSNGSSGSSSDVKPMGVITQKQAAPGTPIRVTSAVENLGEKRSDNLVVHLYLTDQNGSNRLPIPLGTWNIESVPARGENITTRYVNVPDSVPLGVYGLLLDVNPDSLQEDRDNMKNRWSQAEMITITNKSQVPYMPVLGTISTTSSIVLVSDSSRNKSA